MSDFGTMVANISTETRGAIPNSEIKRKIIEAIYANRSERFHFNEERVTWSTVSGQQAYVFGVGGVPSDIIKIDSLVIDYGGRPLELKQVSPQEIHTENAIATPAVPRIYSIYELTVNLYPIPNSIYTVDMLYVKDFNTITVASADSATNSWFTGAGERLIRNFAKYLIYGELLRNDGEEARSLRLYEQSLYDLRRRARQITSGFMPEPWF